jgi:hypothetical protein
MADSFGLIVAPGEDWRPIWLFDRIQTRVEDRFSRSGQFWGLRDGIVDAFLQYF